MPSASVMLGAYKGCCYRAAHRTRGVYYFKEIYFRVMTSGGQDSIVASSREHELPCGERGMPL